MGNKIKVLAKSRYDKLVDLTYKINMTCPDNILGKVRHVFDVKMTEMSDFAEWVKKYRLLNSRLINSLEKELGSIKRIKDKFTKKQAITNFLYKNTSIAVLLADWLLVAGMLGNVRFPVKQNDKKQYKKEAVTPVVKKQIVVNPYVSTSEPDFINKALKKYFPHILVGLAELETCFESPVLISGESRATYYLGLTWVYERNDEGKIIQHPCTGKWRAVAAEFTNKEKQQQLKMHLEHETLGRLQKYAQKIDDMQDHRISIALLWAGYQRSVDMGGIVNLLSKAQTKQDKADAFAYYGGNAKWRRGTLKRRWLCAAYAVGIIDDNDLLNMNMDAFASLKISNYYKRDQNGQYHFLLDEDTVKQVLGLTTKNERVKDFVGKEIVAQLSKNNTGTIEFDDASKMADSIRNLNLGDTEYRNCNYEQAISFYDMAIKTDPDNMEAYNSLAVAYIALGDEHQSVKHYKKACDVVDAWNARLENYTDEEISLDAKSLAAFKAGVANEKIAQIYKMSDSKLSIGHYRKALANYKVALQSNKTGSEIEERAKTYNESIKRVNNIIVAYQKNTFVLASNNMRKKRQDGLNRKLSNSNDKVV
ncbi:MAG: tetratricopeptide repeat protein [Proteobacteria bacterium]|nr:tetratricopeptide repeat protein [Candidatus Enterousia scatequi]